MVFSGRFIFFGVTVTSETLVTLGLGYLPFCLLQRYDPLQDVTSFWSNDPIRNISSFRDVSSLRGCIPYATLAPIELQSSFKPVSLPGVYTNYFVFKRRAVNFKIDNMHSVSIWPNISHFFNFKRTNYRHPNIDIFYSPHLHNFSYWQFQKVWQDKYWHVFP